MKKIPEIRFPEFSGEWVEKRLGEVGEIIGGGTPDTNKSNYWNGNIIWLTPTEIINKKYISNSERKISNEGLKNSSAKLLPINTILITTRATIGEIAITKKECSTNQGFQSLIVKQEYCYEFFYYLLNRKNIKNEMIRKANGTTFLEINKNSLSKIKIHIPLTLDEQKKIADFLSSVDEKIEIVSKKLKELKKYKKGLLQKLLNVKKGEPELRFKGFSGKWVEKRLGEVGEFLKGKGLSKSDLDNQGKYKCILYGELFTTYNEVIKEVISKTNIYEGISSKKGDILLPSSTTTKGIDLAKACALFEDNVLFGGDIIVIRPKTNINSIFLSYLLNHSKQKEIGKLATGMTIYHIYIKDLQPLKIHLPPTLTEQEKIAEFLSSIDEKIELNEKKLQALKSYKQGLLQKMFL